MKRKWLNGQKPEKSTTSYHILLLGITIVVLYWILESAVHVFILHQGTLAGHLFHPDSYELWMRLVVVTLVGLLGSLAQFMVTRCRRAEGALKEYRSHLEEEVRDRTAQLSASHEKLQQEIIEHKKARDMIWLAHAELEQIFNTAADGMCVVDREGIIIRINDTLCRMLGIEKDEATGEKCHDILRDALCGTSRCPLHHFLNGEQPFESDIELKLRGGGNVSCILTVTPLKDADGSLIGIVENFKDITRRKEAEETLRKSEERYRTLVENSHDMIFIVDGEGNFIFTNTACEATLGYSREELRHINGLSLIHPDDLEMTRGRFQRLLEGEVQSNIEYRYKTKDGFYIHILNNSVPIFDSQGKVAAAFGIGRDITERKKIMEALRESEEKYSTLVEQAQDGIVIVQEGVYQFANKAMAEITGYTPEELATKYISDIASPGSRDYIVKRYRSRMAGEKVFSRLMSKIQCKDGTIKDVEGSGTVIKYHGKPALMAIIRDLSERKKIEEELQKVGKLESLGILAGGIAHDFNNLLAAIMGNLSLAEIYVESRENTLTVLQEARKSCRKAVDLTRQLLTFSRGGMPVRKPASISELIKETACFTLRGSNIKCACALADDLWPTEIDQGQISQVISNLVINAKQAMPGGGILEIQAENAVVGQADGLPLEGGNYIKISVRDHGIGIPADSLDKIFDPYFTTKKNGSGLGLAISFSIIKRHEGHLTVASELGVGTTFTIYLPASKKEIFTVEGIEEKKLYPGRGRILFMDDQENLRNMAGRMLKSLGYEVECARDGAEAVDIYKRARAEEKPFEAVILDLTVPGGMGGKEAMEKIHEIDPAAQIIVMSGYTRDPIISEYKRYGFSGVVIKPYEMKELSQVLHTVLKKNSLKS
ncbi:MAG: PAS domain S-box protein [bacterium]